MCYPKPGPRCSAHAAKQVARIQHEALIYMQDHDGSNNWDGFEKLASKLKAARAEYALTPAGLQALERSIALYPDDTGRQLELQKARMERERRINLLHADRRRETKHRANKHVTPAYSNTTLAAEGETLQGMDLHHPDMRTLLAESEVWASKLTADEIATARWYSEGGYEDINSGLTGIVYDIGSTRKRLDHNKAVEHLDAAMQQVDATKTAIVYRRHFFYNKNGAMITMSTEEQQAQFPVGSVYKPGFYMSTSIDPKNARQGNTVAALQIKTRRGAALPAVANQGIGESEILLPRDGEYRVLANDRTVTIIDGNGKPYTINLIQLEEI